MTTSEIGRPAGPGPVRLFGRPLAEGVTLHDLVLRGEVRTGMPFTLNTACVEVGARLPRHSHPQSEIWVVTSGEGVLDRGGEQFSIREGDVVYFEPDIEHEFVNTGTVDVALVSVYWP